MKVENAICFFLTQQNAYCKGAKRYNSWIVEVQIMHKKLQILLSKVNIFMWVSCHLYTLIKNHCVLSNKKQL